MTGVCSHILIGLSLFYIEELKKIPKPVLDGLFLYLAVTALHGNQLFERILLLATEQVFALFSVLNMAMNLFGTKMSSSNL